jgi:hypothetical protein
LELDEHLRDITCEAKDPETSPILQAQHQRPGNGPLAVVFRGPLAPIAAAAEEAQRNARFFAPEDVTEEMTRDQVTVTLTPETPSDRFAPSPWTVVIRNGLHKDNITRPLQSGGDPSWDRVHDRSEWRALAVFDPRAVHNGEFELAVVTSDPSDGERTCTITANDALRIR